jgi:hypothetical protein
MIRLFQVFCKLNFKTLSEKQIFLSTMENFSEEKIPFLKLPCPKCGAKHPIWSYHDSYIRYLISYQNKTIVTDTIDVTRIICSSCNGTHAILPEIIIPFNSYSLLFILSVLKDYFLSNESVVSLCERYQISVSTLYEWKRLFLLHKKLWFGILEDIYHNSLEFLLSIPNTNTSDALYDFFSKNNISFLQGRRKTARSNSS